jgi:hypothetical protein
LFQIVTGDFDGAAETQKKFVNTCPVVAQVKWAAHKLDGDDEAAERTNDAFLSTMSGVADGIPVVGHVKGAVHYACGDSEGGDRAMLSATRTVGKVHWILFKLQIFEQIDKFFVKNIYFDLRSSWIRGGWFCGRWTSWSLCWWYCR